MSLPLSPYLSQISTKLFEVLTSLQGIKISIHICNLREVTLLLFGTINFTTKDQSQLVWTGFFGLWTDWDRSLRVRLRSLNIWNGLDRLRLPVASFWGEKTGLNWTWKHYQQMSQLATENFQNLCNRNQWSGLLQLGSVRFWSFFQSSELDLWTLDGHVWGSLEHEGRPKKQEIAVFCLECSHC